jgi:alpha/beta superfamily hydrolase
MPRKIETHMIHGPVGRLESMLEEPENQEPSEAVLVCHPHPQHGGTMHNKVVTTLARSAQQLGAATIRFNYRGVGASAGAYDEGRGEVDDALAAVAAGRQRWPDAPLWLAGFSFGGVVALRASTRPEVGDVKRLVTVAPSLGKNFADPEGIAMPSCPWLIVQGDADEVIDGALVMDWARRIEPAAHLEVMAGAGHFFHGRLTDLQDLVQPFLAGNS